MAPNDCPICMVSMRLALAFAAVVGACGSAHGPLTVEAPTCSSGSSFNGTACQPFASRTIASAVASCRALSVRYVDPNRKPRARPRDQPERCAVECRIGDSEAETVAARSARRAYRQPSLESTAAAALASTTVQLLRLSHLETEITVEFDLASGTAMLERTPSALRSMLSSLGPEWLGALLDEFAALRVESLARHAGGELLPE